MTEDETAGWYHHSMNMSLSRLRELVMYWEGPEAEEVTEPMSAMWGATHPFRISCKKEATAIWA